MIPDLKQTLPQDEAKDKPASYEHLFVDPNALRGISKDASIPELQDAASTAYLSRVYHADTKTVANQLDLYQSDYAKKMNFGEGLDSSGFYNAMGTFVKKQQSQREMMGTLSGHLYNAYISGERDHKAVVQNNLSELQKMPGYDPKNADLYTHAADDYWNRLESRGTDLQSVIEPITNLFKQSKSKDLSYEELTHLRSKSVEALLTLNPEDQQIALSQAVAAAKVEPAKNQGFFQKLTTSIERGTMQAEEAGVYGLMALTMPSGSSDREQVLRKYAANQAIDEALNGKVNPMAGNGIISNVTLKAAQALPNILGSLTVGGAIAGNVINFQEHQNDLLKAGVSTEKARGIATATAAIQTGAQLLLNRMYLGKIPGAEEALGKIASTPARFLANIGVEGALGVTGVTAQQMAAPTIQSIAKHFDDSIPGANLSEEWKKWKNTTPETLIGLTPYLLLGAGIATFKPQYNASLLTDEQQLANVGIKESYIKQMAATESMAEKQKIFKEGFKDREFGDYQKGAQAVVEQESNTTNTALTDPKPTIVKSGDNYIVQDQQGNPLAQTSSPEMAANIQNQYLVNADKEQWLHLANQIEQNTAGEEIPAMPQTVDGLAKGEKLGIVDPATSRILEFTKNFSEWKTGVINEISGKVAPLISAVSDKAGNALVKYASAIQIKTALSRANIYAVLGDAFRDDAFSKRLGTVLIEDRLRSIRDGFIASAQKAESAEEKARLLAASKRVRVVMPDKEFQDALQDKKIQAAIERHIKLVQGPAEQMHVETGGKLAGKGLNTGAFVNLKAMLGDDVDTALFGGGQRGSLSRQLKKGTKFGAKAEGTAEAYDTDYRVMAKRMLEGNYDEYTKRMMYQTLEEEGVGIVGDKPKDGKYTQFTIQRQPQGPSENMWVRTDLAPELRNALDLDPKIQSGLAAFIAHNLNTFQLAGVTDAVWHTANLFKVLNSTQSGQNVLIELGRKIPGINVLSTFGTIVKKGMQVYKDDPSLYKDILQIAEAGSMREFRESSPINLNPRSWTKIPTKTLALMDKSSRLVMNDFFNNMVASGLAKDTVENRRGFINQLGNYNARLMPGLQRVFKESGLSPFIIAGINGNRNGIRKLMLSPGVEATSTKAAAQMRLVELAGVTMSIVVLPAAINYALWGDISPKDVPFGAIKTGQPDKQGKTGYVDPADWIGVRRGLRNLGVNAAVEGYRKGQEPGRILKSSAQDALMSAMHPWLGPVFPTTLMATTGHTPYTLLKGMPPETGEGGPSLSNLQKAYETQVNPLITGFVKGRKEYEETMAKGKEADLADVGKATLAGLSGMAKTIPPLAGAVGINKGSVNTAETQIRDLATKYKQAHNIPQLTGSLPPSKYKNLESAIRSGDSEGALRSMKTLLKTESPAKISKGITESLERPLLGSKALDAKFRSSLNPEQRHIYDESIKMRRDEVRQIKQLLLQVGVKRNIDQSQR